jgi:transposase
VANKRMSMRKIKEILRLIYEKGFSQEQAAVACGSSKGAVWTVLRKARSAGLLTWADVEHHGEDELEAKLYGPAVERRSGKVLPDWQWVHQELRRKHVTRVLLWEEYRESNVDKETLGLSQFCELYAAWRKSLDLVMRQNHEPGERAFMDFAGDTVTVDAPGVPFQAHLFVSVMGMSNFTFAHAFENEKRASWLAGHALAFEYFGGVPELVVPDNPKSIVHKAHRYEPDLNPEYVELARHYGTAIMPARVARPRDKAKVEAGVQLAERWILAALRHRVFRSLVELNEAIAVLLEKLNAKPFKKLDGSRASAFARHEAPVLKPLPSTRFQVPAWANAKVAPDYHVEVEGHFYSVPYRFRGQRIRVRYTDISVEVFLKDERIAAHARSHVKGKNTWIPEHLPKSHREYVDWSPADFARWAAAIGPATAQLIEGVLKSRPHPALGFRSAFGILGLAKKHSSALLESACARCLSFHGYSYQAVERTLRGILRDSCKAPPRRNSAPTQELHANIRGAASFRDEDPIH